MSDVRCVGGRFDGIEVDDSNAEFDALAPTGVPSWPFKFHHYELAAIGDERVFLFVGQSGGPPA